MHMRKFQVNMIRRQCMALKIKGFGLLITVELYAVIL